MLIWIRLVRAFLGNTAVSRANFVFYRFVSALEKRKKKPPQKKMDRGDYFDEVWGLWLFSQLWWKRYVIFLYRNTLHGGYLLALQPVSVSVFFSHLQGMLKKKTLVPLVFILKHPELEDAKNTTPDNSARDRIFVTRNR